MDAAVRNTTVGPNAELVLDEHQTCPSGWR
jgi:hypothetical protein